MTKERPPFYIRLPRWLLLRSINGIGVLVWTVMPFYINQELAAAYVLGDGPAKSYMWLASQATHTLAFGIGYLCHLAM